MMPITILAIPRMRPMAVTLGVTGLKTGLILVAILGLGVLAVIAIVVFIAIFTGEPKKRSEIALEALRALCGRKKS